MNQDTSSPQFRLVDEVDEHVEHTVSDPKEHGLYFCLSPVEDQVLYSLMLIFSEWEI